MDARKEKKKKRNERGACACCCFSSTKKKEEKDPSKEDNASKHSDESVNPGDGPGGNDTTKNDVAIGIVPEKKDAVSVAENKGAENLED